MRLPVLVLGGSLALGCPSASAARAEAVVKILAVEPMPSTLNPNGRLLKDRDPARFRVTLRNQTDRSQHGVLAAQVVGNLHTVYGLAIQKLTLSPRQKHSVEVFWEPPGPATYESGVAGPVKVAGAAWGHQLDAAWLDAAGRVIDRGSTVFVVSQGPLPAGTKALAKATTLSRLNVFRLRFSGYLDNPAFTKADRLEDMTLRLDGGKPGRLRQGESPAGRRTYLVDLAATGTSAGAVLIMQKPYWRLRQAWLLDPGAAGGPEARRLYHRVRRQDFLFTVPPVSARATLVLEIDKGHFVPPVPLADMVARGEKSFGPFRNLLRGSDGKDLTTPGAWAEHRKQLRRAVQEAIRVRRPARPVPLDPRVISEETVLPHLHLNGLARSYVRRKVSLRVGPGERMNVWLLVPPGVGPFPAVLANHQTVPEGKDEPVGLGGAHYQLNYGPFLAGRGFVVAAADSYGAGERYDARTQAPYDTAAREAQDPGWSLLGQRLHDHRRVLDYLETLPFVDRARIGVIGHSLGGESSAVLAALDERVAAAVVSCPFTLLRTLDKADEVYTARGSCILPARFRKLLRGPAKGRKLPFDFDDCMAVWAPRPVFLHGVRDDLWPNAAQVAQAARRLAAVYRLHGAADRLEVVYSAQAHCFPHWVQDDALDWLEYWLKGPGCS
jgi:dienelactone hydrolase